MISVCLDPDLPTDRVLISQYITMCAEIGTGPYEDLCVYAYESDRRIFYRNTCVGLGLHGQAFGSMGTTEVASGKSCWKLPPCPAVTLPDNPEMEVSLAKAG